MQSSLPNNNFGPPAPTAGGFLLQVLGALGGSAFGTLLMLVIFLLGSSIIDPILSLKEIPLEPNPMFIFLFMAIIFLGTLSANCLSILLIGLANKRQYQRISSTIVQTFFLNIIIFILLAPVYVISSRFSVQSIAYIAALQVILSAIASTLALKIIAAHKYALVGVYSTVFSILLSLGVNLFIYQVVGRGQDLTIVLFSAIPVIWISYAVVEGILSNLYRLLYSVYGMDFLKSDIPYGKDYATLDEEIGSMSEEEQEELVLKEQKEVTGGEFLKDQKPKT